MDIYTYTRPELYLKDMLAAKKEKNPQFSLRAWARLLGMKTHTPLQLMLASKRPIPKKYIPLFGKSLNLSDEEVIYLEIMIDHQRARNEEQKKKCFDRMQNARNTKLSQNEEASEEENTPNLVLIKTEESSANIYN